MRKNHNEKQNQIIFCNFKKKKKKRYLGTSRNNLTWTVYEKNQSSSKPKGNNGILAMASQILKNAD